MTALTQEQILAQAAALADYDDDMNEAVAGGYSDRLLPEGWSVARFTSYIEKGKHVELFKGVAKDPALMFTLGFELFSAPYLNEDGTPYFIETYDISRSRTEKARAFKLFKAMNIYGPQVKNFAQMLGQTFLVQIVHHTAKTQGATPRSIIKDIRAGIDVVTGNPYDCPAPTKLFLFSWAKPTLEAWDTFFIEGTNDQGKSKNWKQEKIAGATDFAGSPLEALLVANGRPIPAGTPQKTGAGQAAAGAAPAGAAPAGVAAPQGAVAPAVVATPMVAVAAAPVAAPAVAAPAVTAPAQVAQPVVAAVAVPQVAAPLAVAPVAPVVAAPVVAA